MVNRKLDRLDIDIVAHNIGRQDAPLGVVDEAARRVQHDILYMFVAGKLRQVMAAMRFNDLPVVESAQQDQHAEADQQENEHLSIAGASQFLAHFLPPSFSALWFESLLEIIARNRPEMRDDQIGRAS